MSVTAIIPAAGIGKRMNLPTEKQYMLLCGKPVIVHTLELFDKHPLINRIILAVSPKRINSIKKFLAPYDILGKVDFVEGGKERCFSVENAFETLKKSEEIVLIHDSVRPFVTKKQIDVLIENAQKYGASALAKKVTDTIKKADGDICKETIDRTNLWSMQTPQVFKRELLKKAFDNAKKTGDYGTDECYIVEKIGADIKLVENKSDNMKITNPKDLELAELIMNKGRTRIGFGMDVHRLVENRKLILGGIPIKHNLGLLGHSDADVLTHAIMDSLLGAVAKGDIGKHFPDTDSKYKNADSIKLLEHVKEIIKEDGFIIENIDAVIVAQKPKISPYIEKIRENLANALELNLNQISVKATTTETLGFEGREEGISAHAVALLNS